MDRDKIIEGLNLWLDAYIADPQAFETEFQTVIDHLKQRENGEEPSYGEGGIAIMEALLAKQVIAG